MKNKFCKLLSSVLCISMIVPNLVSAMPDVRITPVVGTSTYVSTPSETLPDIPDEIEVLDCQLEDNLEITSRVATPGEAEQKTFLNYFPDPIFAQSVASSLEKQASDFTNQLELTTITSISYNGDYLNNNEPQISLEGIEHLTNLEYLSLWGGDIPEIPDSIGNLSNLESLYLCYNGLEELPESIGNLTKLSTLWIYGSRLRTLPESFGNLHNLRSLCITDTYIEAFDFPEDSFPNLEFVQLCYNNIERFPRSLLGAINLSCLEIHGNYFYELPADIKNLKKLKTLVTNVYSQSLPPEIGELENLERFISYSTLAHIPDELWDLPKLSALGININESLLSPKAMGKFKQLILNTNGYTPGYDYRFTLSCYADFEKIYDSSTDITLDNLLPPNFSQLEELADFAYKLDDYRENSIVSIYLSSFLSEDLLFRGTIKSLRNSENPFKTLLSQKGIYFINVESPGFQLDTSANSTGDEMVHVGICNINGIITINQDSILPLPNHTITVTTRYLDDALPESSQIFTVADGGHFEQQFDFLDGYDLYNYSYRIKPQFNTNMDTRTVSIDVVERDYTIELEFDKMEYKIKLNTSYLDSHLPDSTQTNWIRHQEGYSQTYQIAEGYQVANLDQLPDSVIVDETNNTVTINSVIEDYDILLQFERKPSDVAITIIYENDSRENQVTTYTVPYGERFETGFAIEEGYTIKTSQVDTAGVSINRKEQTVTVSQVVESINITITVR